MDRGETEESVLAVREQLEEARRRLDDAQKRTHAFVAMLAHELRTPLGAILMWAHVLRMGRDNDREAAVDAIESSARAQSNLIGELLDVTRAVAGRLRIDRLPVDLGEVTRLQVDQQGPSASAAQIDLNFYMAERPLWVLGDVVRLRQMLSILLDHAVRASAGPAAVNVTLESDDETVRLAIQDQGAGVSAQELKQIFEPFRLPEERDRQRPGALGLELPLVRFLAELHGGTVVINSAGAGRGSTSVLSLPATPKP